MSPLELRQRCHTIVPGHRPHTAAEDFAAMAAWCEANGVEHDLYGEGALINGFERKIAELLGYEAGVFMVSGTMAQTVALRLACEARGSRLAALHPSAHIVLHERSNYQMLEHFDMLPLGRPHRAWTVDDLKALPEKLGAALYELPMREIGGVLPSWDELKAIKEYCSTERIHLHLDGARLWEAATAYGRPLDEVCAGFDSTYVSFYKGIGGMGGAMLLGSADFIARAANWAKRLGGNVWQRSPYVVAAARQFDERLAAMPRLLERARQVAGIVAEFPELTVNPRVPQCNLFHVHLPVGEAAAIAARDRLAREYGIWLFGAAQPGMLAETSYFEWYVGDNLLALSDGQLREFLMLFVAELSGNAQ